MLRRLKHIYNILHEEKKKKDVLDYALLSQICKSTHRRMYVLPDSNFESIFRHST